MKEDSLFLDVEALTDILDIGESALLKMVKRGNIDEKYYRYVRGIGRGGKKLQINPEGLPEPYKLKWFQHQESVQIKKHEGSSELPGWALEKAKARLDVMHLLEKERKRAKAEGRNLTPIYDEAADLFNSGHVLEGAFKMLGKISGYSIQQRWWPTYKKASRRGEDVIAALAPNYNSPTGHPSVPEWYRKLLLKVLLHPNCITPTRAVKIVNLKLRQDSKEAPCSLRSSQRWISSYKEENQDRWELIRHGKKALVDRVLPYLDRDWNLLKVGQVLIADGHVVNFDVKHPRTGKAHRPILICFYDGRSRFPVGFSLMPTENTDNISEALADAVHTLGKFPDAVILDNGRAFKGKFFTNSPEFYDAGLAGLYERHGIIAHFTKPYSGQSKPIEPFWNQLNERFSKMLPTYRGSSIDKKVPRLKRNEKAHKKAYDQQVGDWLPTIREVLQALKDWSEDIYGVEAHSGLEEGETPLSVLEAGKGPGVEWYQILDMVLHAKQVTPRRARFKLEGIVYQNWDVLTGYAKPVLVRYTRMVPDKVWVFEKKKEGPKFMCIARAFEAVHPLEKLTGEDGEFDPTIRERLKQRKRLEKRALRDAEELRKMDDGMTEPIGRLLPLNGDNDKDYEIGRLPDATPDNREEGTEIQPLQYNIEEEEAQEDQYFEYAYERFEHVAGKDKAEIDDKDIAFLRYFTKSNSYEDLYAKEHAEWVDPLISD